MRLAVIGAGIVGVTTAYELADDGHDVTVFERHSSVAAESSFGNAGLLGPGQLADWSGVVRPGRWLRDLAGRTGGLRLRPALTGPEWRWLWRLWATAQQARAPATAATASPALQLAQWSQDRLETLRIQLRLEYERAPGLMVLLRTGRDAELAQLAVAWLREAGIVPTELDAAGARAFEPGLSRDQPMAGALRFPQDGVANCRQFAHLLRDAAERRGVEFRFVSGVRSIQPLDAGGATLEFDQLALSTGFANSRIAMPHQADPSAAMKHRARAAARFLQPMSQETFDGVVVACGAASPALLVPLGLRLPLQPVHGYSVTAPMRAPERGPQAALIDAQTGVSISRHGQRMRIAGGMELGGSPTRQRRAAVEQLFRVADAWFPGAAHIARPQVWKGARPSLPDGPPVIGPSARRGVWLNVGHGASGWALACGSARLLADQIGGRAPALDPSPFSAARYAQA